MFLFPSIESIPRSRFVLAAFSIRPSEPSASGYPLESHKSLGINQGSQQIAAWLKMEKKKGLKFWKLGVPVFFSYTLKQNHRRFYFNHEITGFPTFRQTQIKTWGHFEGKSEMLWQFLTATPVPWQLALHPCNFADFGLAGGLSFCHLTACGVILPNTLVPDWFWAVFFGLSCFILRQVSQVAAHRWFHQP